MKMLLDCLRFRLQPGEAYQEIVGIADIPEPPGYERVFDEPI